MTEWLYRLFGLDGSAELMDADIHFAYPIPAWVVALMLIGILVWCVRLYRREAGQLRPWLRWFLITLRSLAWAALLLLALKPVLHLDYLAEPRSNVAVLVDRSLSMGLADENAPSEHAQGVAVAIAGDADGELADAAAARAAAAGLTRGEAVERTLGNEQLALLARLEERYELLPFAFDVDLRPLERGEDGSLDWSPPDGRITQLGTALRETAARLRGRPLAGIVVFTDGASNKGEDPVVVAEALGARGVAVYPIGVGAEDALDLRVVRAEIPDWLFKDDEVALRVTMAASGVESGTAMLRIAVGDGPAIEQLVDVVPGTFHHDVILTPEQTGDLELTIELEPLPDEQLLENNLLTRQVRVIDSAIRILIAVDTPSWEYRYLKGFLDTDERIDTKVFIRRGDLRKARVEEDFLARFPDIETLNREFDCVILNNIGADYFSPDQLDGLHDYVETGGGSLIMIASTHGTPSTFVDTPIEDMLPVVVERVRQDPSLDLADTFSRPFPLRLTRAGREHPIARMLPLEEDNAELWRELPEQYWYYPGIRRLKQGATALAEHGEQRTAFGNLPLIALQRYGRGQVLFLGINSVWRWRYEIGNRYTNRFWGQTIQYLGLPHLIGNLERVSYDIDAFDWTAGEAIPLSVRVVDADYRPATATDITVIAADQGTGAEERFVLPGSANREGVYSGQLVLPEGRWQLHVDGLAGEGELALRVHEPRFEFTETALQRRSLEAVAAASGGAYLPLAGVHALPEAIAAGSSKVQRSIDRSLWNTWAALILVAVLLASEWITRKMVDLP